MKFFVRLASVCAAAFVITACAVATQTDDILSDGGGGGDGSNGGGGDGGSCTSKCNGMCVDLRTDNSNCGVCGKTCPADAKCVAGSCQCPTTDGGASGSICNGTCVDTKSDVNNCGSCGNKCITGSCNAGKCPCPLKNQCDTGTDVTNQNLTWVVCRSDCQTAWVSMLNQNGGMYHAEYICKQLGYAKLGQHGGTCGNICGYCQNQTACNNLGTEKYDNGGSCGSDQYGQILCQTVMWQCTQ